MRCSLLALSAYIDTELDAEPVSEVEAHLVGCERCRTAMGYLREESQRIGGLTRVHIPEDAVFDLFVQVGLIQLDEDLPGAPGRVEPPDVAGDAPPWFGEARGKALPWAPRAPRSAAAAGFAPPASVREHPSAVAVAEPPGLLFAAEPPMTLPDPWVAAPVPEAHSGVVELEPEPVAPSFADEVDTEVSGAELHDGFAFSAPPQQLLNPPSVFGRIKDRLAVRIALWRGPRSTLDDGIEILGGASPPTWNPPSTGGARRPPAAHLFEPEPALRSEPPAIEPAPPVIQTAPPVIEPPAPAATWVEQAVSRLKPRLKPEAVIEPDAVVSEADPDTPAQIVAPAASAPVTPGRHVRSLRSTHRPAARPWTPAAAPATEHRHALAAGGPAVGAGDRDRRLIVFGAVALVVLIVGLLVGRQVSLAPSAPAASRPSTTPSAAHGPVAVAPNPVATPVPTPTAPAPTAQPAAIQLTGVKTLGAGSSGYSVADVRYGEHPGDFRIVFDLASPSASSTGAPSVKVGYGSATTVYVEFSAVTGPGSLDQPPHGQVLTGLLHISASRVSEQLVYELTLSRAAHFDAYYLTGARLVIDLT